MKTGEHAVSSEAVKQTVSVITPIVKQPPLLMVSDVITGEVMFKTYKDKVVQMQPVLYETN